MLDTVFGVPTHALVVHAVVVLLPLAALGGIAVALVPALRRRYGTVVGLLTVAAVAAVPVATRSGERLFERQSARFGPNDVTEAGLMEEHATLGEDLLPWALLLLAGVALVVVPPLLTRRRERELAPAGPTGRTGHSAAAEPEPTTAAPPAWTRPVALLGVAATLVGAVLSLVMVVRIGHAGSEAAWERLDQPPASLGR